MKNNKHGTARELYRLRENPPMRYFLFLLLLLLAAAAYPQSKTERQEKEEKNPAVLTEKPDKTPLPIKPVTVVSDALDIKTKPVSLSHPPVNVMGIEGADIQTSYAVTQAYIKGDSGKPEMKNGKYRTTAAFGQYLVGDSLYNAGKTGEGGMYGFYKMRPMAPYLLASQGDYADRVEITWSFDPLSPPANLDFFELKRDGELIATMPVTDVVYKDYNTRPGIYYNYELTGINKYGVSAVGNAVGFVNPNGVITGRILTSNGGPVRDVEVLITPNLGKSLYFNGTNTTVSVGNKFNFRDTSFTIEFWMKHNVGEGGVFATGVQGNDVSVDMVGGNMYFDVGTFLTSIPHEPDGQWHHYAWVYDNTQKKMYGYKDSVLVRDVNVPVGYSVTVSGSPAFLGKTLYSSQLFNGNIDEIRIWKTALDRGSVLRNMYRSVSTQAPHLEAYWRMDEGKGSKVFDYASKKHSGTVNGSVAFQDDRAPIRNTTFTDNTGYYIAEGINYGSSTNFTV
ncbi:MAG: LamG domain-containing protein, partial [Ignavibacteriaceae bacterium]|nr:LamG domain-containing protein [Ignavibacteriaceae bacterium]